MQYQVVLLGVERAHVNAQVIFAIYEEQEMMAVRKKRRPDMIGFIVGLVRFRNGHGLASRSRNTVQDALEVRCEYDHALPVPGPSAGVRASIADELWISPGRINFFQFGMGKEPD